MSEHIIYPALKHKCTACIRRAIPTHHHKTSTNSSACYTVATGNDISEHLTWPSM